MSPNRPDLDAPTRTPRLISSRRARHATLLSSAVLLVWQFAVASPAQAAKAGALDTTFGTGGKVTTDFAGDNDSAGALVLQPDGKLVVAGSANGGK